MKSESTNKTKRQPWYERGYRKVKEAMYAATEVSGRGGFIGTIGRITFLAIWASLLIIVFTIWLLTFGGKLLKPEIK